MTLSHNNVAGALYTSHYRKQGISQMSVIQQQQHSQAYVQSSLKHALNSSDFRLHRNVRYDDQDLMDVGNEFQARAQPRKNDLSPNVARRDDGTIRLDVDPDRRRRRNSVSDVRRSMMVRCHEGSGNCHD